MAAEATGSPCRLTWFQATNRPSGVQTWRQRHLTAGRFHAYSPPHLASHKSRTARRFVDWRKPVSGQALRYRPIAVYEWGHTLSIAIE